MEIAAVGLGIIVAGVIGFLTGRSRPRQDDVPLLLPPNNVRVKGGRGTGGLYLTLEFAHVEDGTNEARAAHAFDVHPAMGARLRDELTFQLEALADDDPFERGRDIPLEPGVEDDLL